MDSDTQTANAPSEKAPGGPPVPSLQILFDQSLIALNKGGTALINADTPHLAAEASRTYAATAAVVELLWKIRAHNLAGLAGTNATL